jgi:Protein of unknown function (DUF4242)
MVEQYLPGITARECDEASARLAAAADELSTQGMDLRYVGSTFVPEEDSCFSRFEASSRALVQSVCERAQLPVARIHAVRSLPRQPAKEER